MRKKQGPKKKKPPEKKGARRKRDIKKNEETYSVSAASRTQHRYEPLDGIRGTVEKKRKGGGTFRCLENPS